MVRPARHGDVVGHAAPLLEHLDRFPCGTYRDCGFMGSITHLGHDSIAREEHSVGTPLSSATSREDRDHGNLQLLCRGPQGIVTGSRLPG
jgi:hypothetical protein